MYAVLDTDHFSELVRGSLAGGHLRDEVEGRRAQVFVTVITAQETFEGWFALINRQKAGLAQTPAYTQFLKSFETLVKFAILPFDEDAARVFERLQEQRIRIGTMDLKLASICLAHEATPLTRNVVDFAKVPDLRVENWLE
ncbi:MAG TPA: type II toxin-antitoxin system VapC family toxin [Verrucomicrobiae bacterium]